jgi:glutaredoxin/glutathione-dependent peroxiredoxin
MSIQVGDRLPNATFTVMTPEGPRATTTGEVFGGKRVALVGVLGAFTPVCGDQHLRGFLTQHETLRSKGIDLVACVSVNDVFVMDAWARALATNGRVLMLSDGNAEFAQKLGLAGDFAHWGMGTRSRRYAMLVDDGIVRELNAEAGDELKVSTAEEILRRL